MRSVLFRNEASNEDKAQRTKALLMDAAIAVFAERGVEGAPISAITSYANLANGTFYYHYKDKKEFVEALGRAVAARFVNQVDEAMEAITDGPERVATATQHFIRLAAAESAWGWMIVHALTDLGEFSESISRGIRKDVALGIEQGQFKIDTTNIAFGLLLAVVGAGLKARLENPVAVEIEILTAESVLRMLGLSPERARSLAARASRRILKSTDKSGSANGSRRGAARRATSRVRPPHTS